MQCATIVCTWFVFPLVFDVPRLLGFDVRLLTWFPRGPCGSLGSFNKHKLPLIGLKTVPGAPWGGLSDCRLHVACVACLLIWLHSGDCTWQCFGPASLDLLAARHGNLSWNILVKWVVSMFFKFLAARGCSVWHQAWEVCFLGSLLPCIAFIDSMASEDAVLIRTSSCRPPWSLVHRCWSLDAQITSTSLIYRRDYLWTILSGTSASMIPQSCFIPCHQIHAFHHLNYDSCAFVLAMCSMPRRALGTSGQWHVTLDLSLVVVGVIHFLLRCFLWCDAICQQIATKQAMRLWPVLFPHNSIRALAPSVNPTQRETCCSSTSCITGALWDLDAWLLYKSFEWVSNAELAVAVQTGGD